MQRSINDGRIQSVSFLDNQQLHIIHSRLDKLLEDHDPTQENYVPPPGVLHHEVLAAFEHQLQFFLTNDVIRQRVLREVQENLEKYQALRGYAPLHKTADH